MAVETKSPLLPAAGRWQAGEVCRSTWLEEDFYAAFAVHGIQKTPENIAIFLEQKGERLQERFEEAAARALSDLCGELAAEAVSVDGQGA